MTTPQPSPVTEPTASVPASVQRIVLTGFMGAGKSTIGRLLASHIGWNFLDVDSHLEARTGATIPQLFERHGEATFRRLESSALASALARSRTVLALGGGAPEELTNRLLIEQTPATFTVFLDAPFATLYDRCLLQDIGRPVLANIESAQARFARRRPLYRRISRLIIDTTASTPEETVETILTALNKRAESNSALPHTGAPEHTSRIQTR